MSMTRRAWMKKVAALGLGCLALPVLGCNPVPSEEGLPTYAYDGPLGPETLFEHGVASGDPLADSVLLWTRVSVSLDEVVDVFVEVATDPAFVDRVAADWYVVDGSTDHCLTVDAADLSPGTTYYYRFSALGRTSPTGRTKTSGGDARQHVRWGVCSCSNYGHGHFHAYRHMAARPDLDAVLHLGDYVYEYASVGHGRTYGVVRQLDPLHEVLTVDDYRRRYALYRRDEHLQELHRQNPFIHVWDDHEFANDPEVGGADNHTPEEEGDWSARRDAALQAYAEWMPTRLRDRDKIYRVFDYGSLVRLVMLDRQRRYLWPDDEDGEHYLGREQTDWLEGVLAETSSTWLIFGQGTTFGARDPDGVGRSSWDRASREAVLASFHGSESEELVVLTGDIHKFDVLDVVEDPAAYDPASGVGAAGVEIAVGSISSPGSTSDTDAPQFFWSDGEHRGYCVVDITPERLQADFFGFDDLLKIGPLGPDEEHLKSFAVTRGMHHAVEVDEPIASDDTAAGFAP